MIWLNRKALAKAWGALLMVCLGAGAAAAQGPQLPPDPNDLVRQVVANETKRSVANWHFTWRDTRQKGGITEARQLVETRDGMIARLIALNGKPLSPEQSLKEDHRLQRLLNNPDELAKKKRQQKEDEDRVTRMVKALPDAFLFHYAGTEESPEGTLVKMTFEPNPAFAPSSRELQVYEGMKGALVVNLGGLRLAAIDARLFRDVNFGWGIL